MAVASNTSRVARHIRLWGGAGASAGSTTIPEVDPEPVPGSGVTINYTLEESSLVSLGIYDSNGVKVRDLMGGVRQAAGTYQTNWDAKDDFGTDVAGGTYTARLLSHNLGWTYSALFNTSKNPTGIGMHSSFSTLMDFAIGGTTLIINRGYTEGAVPFLKAAMATPNTFSYFGSTHTYIRPFRCCADATSLYYIGGYPLGGNPHRWGVLKRTLSSGAQGTFSGLTSDGLNIEGSDFGTAPNSANFSKVFLNTGDSWASSSSTHTYDLSGIAVQITGNYLAFSQPGTGKVFIYHKGTGAAVATITLSAPTALCWSPDETELWVADGTNIKAIADPAGTPAITTIATGQTVCDLAASSASYNRVCAALGNHQIKNYNASTKGVVSTIGASGGYASTTVFADNRFHFYGMRQSSEGSITGVRLQFDANDDLCTFQRVFQLFQRFDDPNATPTSDDASTFKNLFCTPYTFGAERTAGAKMVVNRWMVLSRNWSITNKAGYFGGYVSGVDPTPAWTLDSWFGYAYEADDPNSAQTIGMNRLWIGNTGKLYGILVKANEDVYISYFHSTGVTEGTYLGNKAYYVGFDDSGNYYLYDAINSQLTKGTLTGFTANLPQYSTSTTYNWATDSSWLAIGADATQWLPILSDSTIIMHQPAITGTPETDATIYHVAAIKSDGTLMWRQALCQNRDRMPIPRDGKISSKSANGGSSVAGANNLCVLSAQGEGYESGQAGAHNVYDKYGLYVNTIGHETPTSASTDQKWPCIGENGNAQSCVMIYDGSKYRYLFNDENHSAIHEFTSDNLASMQYTTGSAAQGGTINLGTVAAAAGGPSVYGSAGFTETWNRSDSDTIGNSWTEVNNGLELSSNLLKAKTGEYNTWLANHIYRNPYTGATASNVSLRLTIPAGGLSLYTRDNGSEHRSMFGLFARYNTATKLRIGVNVSYVRNGNGDDTTEGGNGYFTAWFYAYDGTTSYDLGTKQASAIDGWDTDVFSLSFNVTGTQPTRMHYSLFNETTGEEVLSDYAELWDTSYESAGKVGMNLGMENVRCSKFEEYALTWSSVLPPIR